MVKEKGLRAFEYPTKYEMKLMKGRDRDVCLDGLSFSQKEIPPGYNNWPRV